MIRLKYLKKGEEYLVLSAMERGVGDEVNRKVANVKGTRHREERKIERLE